LTAAFDPSDTFLVRVPAIPLPDLRVLHIGGYWRGSNDMVRQMMLGLRGAGVNVVEFSTDDHPEALDTEGRLYDRGTSGPVWLRMDCLAGSIERLEPHVVVCNAGGLSFRPRDSETLRRTTTLIGIALSDPEVYAPTTSHIAVNFDLFCSNCPELVPAYCNGGARARPLPLGTNADFFRPGRVRPELACDVLVVGRVHPNRVGPVRALADRFDTHVYGEGWEEHGIRGRGLLFGDDLSDAIASSRATVVFLRTRTDAVIVKVALLDFVAAGALVLTDWSPAVEPYFNYGTEVIGFRSVGELLEKVEYSLQNASEADKIRRAARERVLREHTWAQVWPRILAGAMEDGAD
jgi:spore maturation protein CgeB